jgi:plastocyanin
MSRIQRDRHADQLLRATGLIAALALGLGAAGCGSDAPPLDAPPPSDSATIDAAIDAAIDGPPAAATVVQVTCPTTPDATVTTASLAFTPNAVTIQQNQIVRFAPESDHNVIPHPTLPSDPGLRSGALGEVRCLQFTETGTFNYRCSPHAVMTGSVTVE